MRKIKRAICVALSVLLCAESSSIEAFAAQEDRITIRILHFWGDTATDPSCEYFNTLLGEFEDAFPNVDLVQITCDNATYKQKIKVLMASDELPDIMFCYGGGFSDNFVEAGRLLPLDDYLSDFYKEHVIEKYQENFFYDGKQYGIGFSQWMGVLYCNLELFEEYNLSLPTTYQQLRRDCLVFRNAGVDSIACGMADKWAGAQLVNNFMLQLCGTESYNNMAEVKESTNNSKVAHAAQYVTDLLRRGAFSENMMSMNSGDGEEEFLSGKAAMIYNGSWFAKTAYDRLGDKVEAIKMPTLPEAIETDDYHGGCANGWMVSSSTEYPELAVQIIEWLSYNIGTFQPENSTFQIDEGDVRQEMDPLSSQIQELYKDKGEGVLNWDVLMTPEHAELWLNTCAELLAGFTNGKGFSWTLDSNLY